MKSHPALSDQPAASTAREAEATIHRRVLTDCMARAATRGSAPSPGEERLRDEEEVRGEWARAGECGLGRSDGGFD